MGKETADSVQDATNDRKLSNRKAKKGTMADVKRPTGPHIGKGSFVNDSGNRTKIGNVADLNKPQKGQVGNLVGSFTAPAPSQRQSTSTGYMVKPAALNQAARAAGQQAKATKQAQKLSPNQ